VRIPFLLAASTLALAAQAGVSVTFVEPEKYTDVGRYRYADGVQVQKELRAHLMKLGEGLPASRNLAIEILDIDLAGEQRFHYGSANDVRIQRGGADWPTIRLRYSLERDGKGMREVRLSDMNYQQRVPLAHATETFPYEKRLLTDWFHSLELSTEAK
jgi:hypothetical protein